MEINQITERVIGAAIEVHRHLGPGLLESAYHQCLCHELTLLNIRYQTQVPLGVEYKGRQLDCGYRIDILVENVVVIEVKAVEHIAKIHDAQLLTYLKLGGWKVGLLINFNVPVLRRGIRRMVNELPE